MKQIMNSKIIDLEKRMEERMDKRIAGLKGNLDSHKEEMKETKANITEILEHVRAGRS